MNTRTAKTKAISGSGTLVLHPTHFEVKGGKPSFAAVCTNSKSAIFVVVRQSLPKVCFSKDLLNTLIFRREVVNVGSYLPDRSRPDRRQNTHHGG